MTRNKRLVSVSTRLLTLIMPLSLLGGCDFELPDYPVPPGGEDDGGDGGMGEECKLFLDECLSDPDIPEDVCFDEFEQCFGGGEEGGEDHGCEEPPPFDCEPEYLWCLEEIGDPDVCEEILWQCEDPGEPPPSDCEDEFFQCLDAGLPPEACEEILWQCEDPGEPPPRPGCEEEFFLCLEAGIPPEVCEEEVLANCEDPGEPSRPGCEEEYEWCIEETMDPELCEEILVECEGGGETGGDPGNPDCEVEFGECLDAGIPAEVCEEIFEGCKRP